VKLGEIYKKLFTTLPSRPLKRPQIAKDNVLSLSQTCIRVARERTKILFCLKPGRKPLTSGPPGTLLMVGGTPGEGQIEVLGPPPSVLASQVRQMGESFFEIPLSDTPVIGEVSGRRHRHP
jgi:hypothetical protein